MLNIVPPVAQTRWQEDVFRILKAHDVRHVVYVPDAGHSVAIDPVSYTHLRAHET